MKEYICMADVEIEREKKKLSNFVDEATLEHKATIFKILGDLNRVKIVEILSHYPQLCVNEIAQFIDASVATTSHHLITLKNNGIIKSVKEGKHVIYMLDTDYVTSLFETVDLLRVQCPKMKAAK
ncbi:MULTISPECIES: ArsR/SmtB family transcription factor [Globicatella]|uniref:DNA-binding transcriptional regulator, ArsR family n=2 Tax=Globicatella sulfidifaciens TaxID=136093 RepID=A0A1T4PA36_9LACT|nr:MULTISPECIES: metalloregulator ArsR/SmtB family transcription factor [Globicatella]MDK7630172.1 metalloregulator ArsR/SmtB family transcription factor [Globicatella sanguinis]MDT2767739.1 metalloregulator ArsR/SmtB family transcription factor [Globicatella sulfidifaciens]NLJ18581.1 winged helix-turn-helix transcriptional regulator [Globicatella sulfidifaciens]WIK65979.1 metalloregulator ArsR/SmtB family transcription factor [Globicatella sanguinis]WKT55384.1 metalloregulator ArsR/SmtB famil